MASAPGAARASNGEPHHSFRSRLQGPPGGGSQFIPDEDHDDMNAAFELASTAWALEEEVVVRTLSIPLGTVGCCSVL